MFDIVLEVFRAVILLAAVIFLWSVGRNQFEASPEGWKLIVAGLVLLLFGSLLDITDNFESLNVYVVIGDTEEEAFLEKVVGFLGGFVLLSIGLVRWMPRVQVLVREVSQRKQAEEALRQAQDELLRRERLVTLGRLTATVSHELRNPLGTIRTSTSLLRDGLDKGAPRAWRALDRVERSVIRCDRIIDELLDYTRIQDLEPELTPIGTWMSEVLDEQTIPSGIQLRQEFDLPGAMVPFDRDRLRRAVINVLDNACQAMTGDVGARTMETEPTLFVHTRHASGRVELIFEDTGPGIPPDLSTKIFEPMFSTKGFGVGLGLPVVSQIMEQHDGGIEIESEDGRGAKVCLWLPYEHSAR